MPTLVVSDANIIIDMEQGRLLDEFFNLPFTITIPDLLYHDELAPYLDGLPTRGLEIRSLSAESVRYVDGLADRGGPLPSANDRIALGLSRQEGCILLTGDQSLRRLAEAEGVEVHGTLWVMEELMRAELIAVTRAAAQLDLMLENGSHLPSDEIDALLKRYGWQPPP